MKTQIGNNNIYAINSTVSIHKSPSDDTLNRIIAVIDTHYQNKKEIHKQPKSILDKYIKLKSRTKDINKLYVRYLEEIDYLFHISPTLYREFILAFAKS